IHISGRPFCRATRGARCNGVKATAVPLKEPRASRRHPQGSKCLRELLVVRGAVLLAPLVACHHGKIAPFTFTAGAGGGGHLTSTSSPGANVIVCFWSMVVSLSSQVARIT